MSVKIRLMRVGKKKQPTYRVVVADARSPRDGRVIETIGHYGPRTEPSRIEIDGDRALEWLRKGAQPSEQVQKLLAVTGVWATYESEKKGPIVTKLNRRGFTTGKALPAKAKKPPKDETGDPPAAEEAPGTEEQAVEEPAAEAPAAAEPEPEAEGEEPE